jgi:hypothetical protein
MASSLIKGVVTLNDGTELEFSAGPRERIKAERHFKINLRDLAAQEIGEEYMVYLAYLGLVHSGQIDAKVTFDQFIDDNLGDYEVSDDPK